MSKRNAALEAILGPAVPETGDGPSGRVTAPAGEGPSDKIVPLRSAKPRRAVTKVMLYLPAKVARKFKEIAFTEDCKANDVYLDALDLYLAKQGYGGVKAVSER